MTEKAIKKNFWQMPGSSPYLQRNLVMDNGRLLVQVLKRMDLLWQRKVHKEFGIQSRKKMLLEFAESGHLIFRATTPLSRGKLKSKGHGKLSIHYFSDQATIETIFRIIAFANQLSLFGAVANMCEEFEFHQDRSGQPDVLMGPSIVLSEIKTEVADFLLRYHVVLWAHFESL